MGAIYQNILTWEAGGQLFSNVLHYNLEETGSFRPDEYAVKQMDMQELNVIPVWLDVLSTTVTLMSQKCQKIQGTGGPMATRLYGPTDWQGTRSGSIGNTSENVVLEFPVHLNSKNVTGKVFVSGILDADIVDNVITDTVKGLVNALGTSLLGEYSLDSGAGHSQYVIYNRENGFFATPLFRQIGFYVGSQRRRLRP